MASTEKKPPITILDLRDSPWHDGPGRTIIEVASGLKGRGIDIKIASFVSQGDGESDYLDKAREKGLECFEIKESKTFDFAIVDQIVAIHRQIPFDIIHSHDLRTNVFGLIAARKLKLPIVATMHGWVANTLKRKVIMILGNMLLSYLFNAVITVSDKVQKRLRRYRPISRLITIHNTLDTKAYGRIELGAFRRSLNIPNGMPLFAKIGRLSPEKRQEQLLRAAKQLLDQGYRFKLLLIGIGPDEAKLRQLTQQLEISEAIVFTGFIQDMLPVYSDLDLVVQTSSTEGLPNVILEAMLMRVPVIATDVGGTSEVIDSPDVGTLIEPDNAQMLVAELKSFLDTPDAYRNKLDRAEQRIREHFDSDQRLQTMAALYRELLD
jgi:glycosyltransferase involved in cell wall biosynthesis